MAELERVLASGHDWADRDIAAQRILFHTKMTEDRRELSAGVRALGQAVHNDASVDVRLTSAMGLADILSTSRRKRSRDVQISVASTMRPYAQAGTEDDDPDVALTCELLAEEIDATLAGRPPHQESAHGVEGTEY